MEGGLCHWYGLAEPVRITRTATGNQNGKFPFSLDLLCLFEGERRNQGHTKPDPGAHTIRFCSLFQASSEYKGSEITQGCAERAAEVWEIVIIKTQAGKPPHLHTTCQEIQLTRELTLPRTGAAELQAARGTRHQGHKNNTVKPSAPNISPHPQVKIFSAFFCVNTPFLGYKMPPPQQLQLFFLSFVHYFLQQLKRVNKINTKIYYTGTKHWPATCTD
ncbi:uncharacterized protein LOC119695124 [Motacilla alba alba]|uniref:uncharacterized protein LOC119695124 n=1 Tax=Motacilla alba alba TaxID=1094192 RepID=UPI0018D54070|nr:uncharacterized protein LOC119695124 [Motacilla alba alba]